MNNAFELLGDPCQGGVLIVADHASNHVPNDVMLGVDPRLLNEHIGYDIGVGAVARHMVADFGFAAFMGAHSRLVADLNRDAHDPGAIPHESDGHVVPGNALDSKGRAERLARFHTPYHEALATLLADRRPALILSLHSFTPSLAADPHKLRPWDVGVLYNDYEKASRLGIELLRAAGLIVGDQLPYSGKLLNATMNRHAEANGIAYWGIEMRQDKVAEAEGQRRFAFIIGNACVNIVEQLA